jgi:hypothetical protein
MPMPTQHVSSPAQSVQSPFGMFAAATEYMIDAAQRSILFWDVMRQRGNQRREQMARPAPNVLDYQFELIIDGRKLDRPINYALVKIIPPEGVMVDPKRRPFVVVDPRAGHGPALAGSRPTARSESHSKPVIPAISSASCRTPSTARRSKILRVAKRFSSRK